MITNITIINKIMNEYLLKYLQQGYVINTQTMHGLHSDCPFRIDLSRGKEFVRIYGNRETAYRCKNETIKELSEKYGYDNYVYTIAVAYRLFNHKSSFASHNADIWLDELETIESSCIYTVGWSGHLGYTQDVEDVVKACEVQSTRLSNSSWYHEEKKKYTDIEHLRIGLRVVKKQPRTKTIHLENIDSVCKYTYTRRTTIDSYYVVYYTTNSGKSDSVRIG